MLKGSSSIKSRGLPLIATAVIVGVGILLDPSGFLALVSLGVGIGFLVGTILK
jgi:hypothetical protein